MIPDKTFQYFFLNVLYFNLNRKWKSRFDLWQHTLQIYASNLEFVDTQEFR